MISAGDFRNGMCFEMDGQVFQVVEQIPKQKKYAMNLNTVKLI